MFIPGEADSQGASWASAGPRVLCGVRHVCGASLLWLWHGAGQEQGICTFTGRPCPVPSHLISCKMSMLSFVWVTVPRWQRSDGPRQNQRQAGLCVQSGAVVRLAGSNQFDSWAVLYFVTSMLFYFVWQDFTVFGGSLSGAHAQKICKVKKHKSNLMLCQIQLV